MILVLLVDHMTHPLMFFLLQKLQIRTAAAHHAPERDAQVLLQLMFAVPADRVRRFCQLLHPGVFRLNAPEDVRAILQPLLVLLEVELFRIRLYQD